MSSVICFENKRKNLLLHIFVLISFLIFTSFFVWQFRFIFFNDMMVSHADCTIFNIIGKGWAHGVPCYTLYFDHKGPMIFLFFCLGELLNPNNNIGLYIMDVLSIFISMYMLFCMSKNAGVFRTLKGNVAYGIVSSFAMTSIFLCYTMQRAIIATETILPFLLGCVWLLFKFIHDEMFFHKKIWHFVYGFCCMAVLLSRPSDAIFIFFTYVFVWIWRVRLSHSLKCNLVNIGLTILGGFLLFISFYLYFAAYGAADKFMDATFWSNFKYVNGTAPVSDTYTVDLIILSGVFVFVFLYLFWIFRWRRFYLCFSYLIPFAISCVFLLGFSTCYVSYHTNYFISAFACLLFSAPYVRYHYCICGKYNKFIFRYGIGRSICVVCLSIFLIAFSFVCKAMVMKDYRVYYYRYDNITKHILNTYDSYDIFDCYYVNDIMVNTYKHFPEVKYPDFQFWFVGCGTIDKQQIIDDIDQHKPECILIRSPELYNQSDDEDMVDERKDKQELFLRYKGIYSSLMKYVFEHYDLVRIYNHLDHMHYVDTKKDRFAIDKECNSSCWEFALKK